MKDNKTFRCDFCQEETDWVARVAIAAGYDRMYAVPKYACRTCHDKKENERQLSDQPIEESELPETDEQE